MYPGNFLKFSFGGTLAGGEIWTNSINLAPVGLNGWGDATVIEDLLNTQLNDFTADLETFFRAIRGSMSNTTTLSWSKLAVLGPDGRYVQAPVSRPVTPITGSQSSNRYPNQIALALSMQSDAWGARGKNGRIYIAGIAYPLGTDGRIEVAGITTFANAFANFLRALKESGEVFMVPNVVPVIASAVGEGAFNEVKRVRVGRVLDTIRSRRGDLDEDYNVIELDAPAA